MEEQGKKAAAVEEKKGSILMHLPGIEGSSREKGYEGWLPVFSYRFGMGLGVGSPGGYGRQKKKVAVVTPTEGGEVTPAPEEEVLLIIIFSIIIYPFNIVVFLETQEKYFSTVDK